MTGSSGDRLPKRRPSYRRLQRLIWVFDGALLLRYGLVPFLIGMAIEAATYTQALDRGIDIANWVRRGDR